MGSSEKPCANQTTEEFSIPSFLGDWMLMATLLQPPSVWPSCRTHIQTPEHFAPPTGKEVGIMFGSADRTKPKQKSNTGSILAKGKDQK